MKYMIVLLLALFSTLSIAQETAPFTPDQEKQIENLIHAALFNDPASPRIGAKHPKLTLVNFTDYNCPYCKQLDPMLEKIVQKYPDVAVIIKPLPFKGESSVLAARIALTTGASIRNSSSRYMKNSCKSAVTIRMTVLNRPSRKQGLRQ